METVTKVWIFNLLAAIFSLIQSGMTVPTAIHCTLAGLFFLMDMVLSWIQNK